MRTESGVTVLQTVENRSLHPEGGGSVPHNAACRQRYHVLYRPTHLPFQSSALGQKPNVIASSASLSRRSLLSCCAIFSSPFCCSASISGDKVILPGMSSSFFERNQTTIQNKTKGEEQISGNERKIATGERRASGGGGNGGGEDDELEL